MTAQAKVAAFRIERRSVAAAIFHGTHLEHTDLKQLSSDSEKAAVGAVGFINGVLSDFGIAGAVIERSDGGRDTQSKRLHTAIEQTLRDNTVPIYRVGNEELLSAFSHPPPPSRKDQRRIVSVICPVLVHKKEVGPQLDAIALGLYFQTERLFQN